MEMDDDSVTLCADFTSVFMLWVYNYTLLVLNIVDNYLDQDNDGYCVHRSGNDGNQDNDDNPEHSDG